LKPLVPGLNYPGATDHQLDDVVCALTALLWQLRKTRTVGLSEEGLMTIPDPLAFANPASSNRLGSCSS